MRRKGEIKKRIVDVVRNEMQDDMYAVVKSVNQDQLTCDVAFDKTVRRGVLLRGTTAESGGFIMLPAVGSTVIISTIKDTRSYVSMYSRVDKVVAMVDGVELSLDKDGFVFQNNDNSLKKTLSDLCTAIGLLTVTTNVGPSGPPINVADFNKIKSDLDKYLK